jgi:hypothetical protein
MPVVGSLVLDEMPRIWMLVIERPKVCVFVRDDSGRDRGQIAQILGTDRVDRVAVERRDADGDLGHVLARGLFRGRDEDFFELVLCPPGCWPNTLRGADPQRSGRGYRKCEQAAATQGELVLGARVSVHISPGIRSSFFDPGGRH